MCDQQSLRSVWAYAQSDQSLCLSLEYSMSVELLTDHHLEFLRLKGGCTGSSESALVKIPHCWKSHVAAHIFTQDKKLWTLVLSHCPDSPDNDQISCAVVSIVFIIVSGIYLQKTNSQGLLGTFQVRTKP